MQCRSAKSLLSGLWVTRQGLVSFSNSLSDNIPSIYNDRDLQFGQTNETIPASLDFGCQWISAHKEKDVKISLYVPKKWKVGDSSSWKKHPRFRSLPKLKGWRLFAAWYHLNIKQGMMLYDLTFIGSEFVCMGETLREACSAETYLWKLQGLPAWACLPACLPEPASPLLSLWPTPHQSCMMLQISL